MLLVVEDRFMSGVLVLVKNGAIFVTRQHQVGRKNMCKQSNTKCFNPSDFLIFDDLN